ncbi:hypothetical protein SAMN05216466_106209 [Paraburkholderia phenazinium]|uniref:Uncharacterized protein n=1 Tax=Paraburkholderia phenazinium TaxID=60549 RepID=A0A1G7YIR0_9BURK|nr:hypothetical protein [Paraburkholderia phenazinium]SDG96452.1 hypothetical protein SAMN05216466_106209 [Paraburkholderia phenazinium]
MPVTLHPFWLGTGGVPSIPDPQLLALALMVACGWMVLPFIWTSV